MSDHALRLLEREAACGDGEAAMRLRRAQERLHRGWVKAAAGPKTEMRIHVCPAEACVVDLLERAPDSEYVRMALNGGGAMERDTLYAFDVPVSGGYEYMIALQPHHKPTRIRLTQITPQA